MLLLENYKYVLDFELQWLACDIQKWNVHFDFPNATVLESERKWQAVEYVRPEC